MHFVEGAQAGTEVVGPETAVILGSVDRVGPALVYGIKSGDGWEGPVAKHGFGLDDDLFRERFEVLRFDASPA
jgi:hypothetical protein